MEALKDVFDTNHNGTLDSGDADWSEFKLFVTNAERTSRAHIEAHFHSFGSAR
jgi:hypothetical protein